MATLVPRGKPRLTARVQVRYAIGSPELAHIKRWNPFYREFVWSHVGVALTELQRTICRL